MSVERAADAAVTRADSTLAEMSGNERIKRESQPAPLEAWKSARRLAIVRRQLGDAEGARAAFAEAARAVGTIAAGTRDEGLRNGFLAQPLVREVLDAVPGEGPSLSG